MGYGRIKHQKLFNAIMQFYKPHSGNIREQAAGLVDEYGDKVREAGSEPTTDELKCAFGAALRKIEDAK